MDNYKRPIVAEILTALKSEPKKLLHILIGPRQVGKSTAAMQIAQEWDGPVISVSADSPVPPDYNWLSSQWNRASRQKGTLFIVDEVQKVHGWSEVVKALWDKAMQENNEISVLLLGSSALLLQKGLTESLAGRFFVHRCMHWDYPEMKKAFSLSFDEWIYFGGYPGTIPFRDNHQTWSQYIRDSLIETVIARDVLQMQSIAKPALLRHLFLFAMSYPAQIFSYNKILGQLQDAGNTTTLSHYISLLESAFLISGLEQFHSDGPRKRGSSPKLIIWNNALVNAVISDPFQSARDNHAAWGRLVENAVGAYLLNRLNGTPYDLFYWRNRDKEVDFVIRGPQKLVALEVQSGDFEAPHGMKKFLSIYPHALPLFIGSNGIPFEEFFSNDPLSFV